MALSAGTRLGPYEIVDRLGAGGMGEVFRALDTRLHRTVAIKILADTRMADPVHHRRFLQEARAASALNHPNIVILYDISNQDGMDFLVMEHVLGQTLKSLVPDEGMPLDTVIAVGAQIASALAAAHDAGIVHRDIKPANVMVTPDQQVKVLDFGVAKLNPLTGANPDGETETVFQNTAPGIAVGTISYMSPEQTRGETVDGRSDIFSLGCVLYEAATGRHPFKGASALAIMHEIATVTPPAPSRIRADLPRSFDELIAACLAKSPEQRPASATDVAHALTSLAAPTGTSPVRPALGRRSVAVIPFRFRTSINEDQFLSVALSDTLANRLASNEKLLIRPTASVLKYAGTDAEWTQVARELNVDLVVEGAIQKMGPKIRVLVQVHQASDWRTVHSSHHDGGADDLFGFQDRIADAVSEIFAPRKNAASSEPAVPPTKNPLAYELYLRAVDRLLYLNKFDIGSGIEILRQVVELDPNFAAAWGQLAFAYAQMGSRFDPSPEWFERAEQAIATALELDPVQSDAQCARGYVLFSPARRFQTRAALRALNAAVKVDPNSILARMMRAGVLVHLGFYDQAERDCGEILLLNPNYSQALQIRSLTTLYRGDYHASQEWLDRCLKLDPAGILTNIFTPLAPLLLGRIAEARENLRKARQMVPDESQLISLDGLIAAHEGNFQQAEQLADDACSENRKSVTHSHHTWHYAAGVYAMCGKPEKAMVQLHRSAELGLPNHLLFAGDPCLGGLRGRPDFTELLSYLRRQNDELRAEFGFGEGLSG